jgi:hypothetical protein
MMESSCGKRETGIRNSKLWNINLIKIAIVYLLLLQTLFGNGIEADIILKNSQCLNVEITDIYWWGLRLSDNRVVLHKLIDRIETSGDSLTIAIQSIIPGIAIQKDGDTLYVINYQNAAIPKIPRKSGKFFSETSFSVTFASSRQDQFDFQTYFNIKNGFLNIGLTHGNTEKVEYGYGITGFNFGLGFSYTILEKNAITIAACYSLYTITIESSDTRDAFFLTSSIRHYLKPKRFFACLGVRYYITEIEQIDNFKKIGFLLGLGLTRE